MNKTSKKSKETPKKDSSDNIFKAERTPRYFIVSYLMYTICAFIIWPLLDLLLAAIFKQDYQYDVRNHIISPAIAMLILTIIEFATWSWWHKDTKK